MTDNTDGAVSQALTGQRRLPGSGGGGGGDTVERVVILLHGIGADGEDLMPLADAWSAALPGTAFYAPNAPEACDFAPSGRQWFSLREASPQSLMHGVQSADAPLNRYIDDVLAAHALSDPQMAVAGFSQGAMMAMYTVPRRPQPAAGVLGYSGLLIGGASLAKEAKAKPPFLLIHGEEDDVVEASGLRAAVDALQAAGFRVESDLRPGLGHSIDETGLRHGQAFLQKVLLPH